jgi:hypothetical protein
MIWYCATLLGGFGLGFFVCGVMIVGKRKIKPKQSKNSLEIFFDESECYK